jgi:hypothetical protein
MGTHARAEVAVTWSSVNEASFWVEADRIQENTMAEASRMFSYLAIAPVANLRSRAASGAAR